MRFKRRLTTMLLVCGLWQGQAHAASDEDIAEAGDVVQLLLPAAGYAGALLTGDKQGAYQLTKVLLAGSLTTHSIKFMAERLRPDGSDQTSFPSGHTFAAYGGAEFIRVRYGNAWGIPAHIAAAFVGYSRIRAQKHFADDVLAGASSGLLWNWYFTSPYSEVLDLKPVMTDDGYAVEFNYRFDHDVRFDADYERRPRFKYNFEFGPVTQDKNLFTAPPATGTELDLAVAETELDITSRVTFTHFFAPRHEWEAYLGPMELIEFDEAELIPGPVDFAGETFTPTPGSVFRSRYNFAQARLLYRYTLLDSGGWWIKVGGGAQYADTYLEIIQAAGDPDDLTIVALAEAESIEVNALLSAHLGYDFNERWGTRLEMDGVAGSNRYYDAALLLNWRVTPEWEFGLGARFISWRIVDDTLKNELEVGDLVLKVAYTFH